MTHASTLAPSAVTQARAEERAAFRHPWATGYGPLTLLGQSWDSR
ncbi:MULTISPECIES: hypothetical protein [Streptomyces]|uniref:Uncharacterized protein n=1 Tax=Streptomyces doebereineriae TaxID=3075528 RepID=A0ABU2V3G5_9ACTN|nr:hypothetical protein [Streptomyces sp. DSM 41640]MDT0479923.1 hypothetical protein [Streptomyces sp. DSM 41640]